MYWFDGQNWFRNSILNGRILELGSEDEMPKVVIESSKATNNDEPRDNNKPTSNVEGSPQYYQLQGHPYR